ncbi:MAG: hypothetical protein ACE5FY_07210 [Nitrospiria bacterium]
MKKNKKKKEIDPNIPKCPFCGRRITVKHIDERLYNCTHCEKMFEIEK